MAYLRTLPARTGEQSPARALGCGSAKQIRSPETQQAISSPAPVPNPKRSRGESSSRCRIFLPAISRLCEIKWIPAVKNSQRSRCFLVTKNWSLQQELRSSWVSAYLIMNPQQHLIQQLFPDLFKNPHQRFTEQLIANIHCLQDSMGALQAENQRLRQEVQDLQGSQQALLAENQRLQQELKSLQRAQIPEETAHQMLPPETTAFPVQVKVKGETGGYEKQFLDDVAKLLVGQGISLQAEDYKENSEHLLLLFCPIATHMAADIGNALKELGGAQKALLVTLHHKPKDSRWFFVDNQQQVPHPALVATVHARYSIQDGFYHCQANTDAMASVATAIQQLMRVGN
ncbi:UNVERIFIED_CONTAM: hypothetical protein K2H54_033435 [Gekko kuhli]